VGCVSALGTAPPLGCAGWLRHYRYDPRAEAVVLRPGYVWHCPVRLHPDDPVLADEQWQHVANRLMTATGLHQAGCRWIAVRHADDHIHLVATLSTSAPANVCTPTATTSSCGKRAGSWNANSDWSLPLRRQDGGARTDPGRTREGCAAWPATHHPGGATAAGRSLRRHQP
jgi:hypothetical protein